MNKIGEQIIFNFIIWSGRNATLVMGQKVYKKCNNLLLGPDPAGPDHQDHAGGHGAHTQHLLHGTQADPGRHAGRRPQAGGPPHPLYTFIQHNPDSFAASVSI